MKADDVRRMLRARPFAPVRIALSDGRCVTVRHPDQVVVSDRVLFIGLTSVSRSKPLATPRSGETIAKDWMMVNLLHVAAVEPENGQAKRDKKPRGRRA